MAKCHLGALPSTMGPVISFMKSLLNFYHTDIFSFIETHNNIRSTVPSESSGVKLTRFEIEGWLELIRMPAVNILQRSDCAWPIEANWKALQSPRLRKSFFNDKKNCNCLIADDLKQETRHSIGFGVNSTFKIAQFNYSSHFLLTKNKNKSAVQAVCTKCSTPALRIFYPSPPEETHLSPSHGMKVSLEWQESLRKGRA